MMIETARCWAVIPAAGSGSRFGGSIPKQYQLLAGKTVLEHSVAALLALPCVEKVVVAVGAGDAVAATLPGLQDSRVLLVKGGTERAQSVLNGVHALQDVARQHDWILVHDAARPCLDPANVWRLIESLVDDAVGGILAIPTTDTLKRVQGDVIEETVDRTRIWQAQTPQMFRYAVLQQSLQVVQAKKLSITDEAAALETCGYAVRIVEGSRSNIKITYAEDLSLANFYLQQRQGGTA